MNFESYQKAYGGKTLGQVQKENSENWLEWNFKNDIGYQTAYLFDFYHDNQKTKIKNFHPDKDMIPIEIIYHDHTSQTYSKDVITHHIQMRPSQRCNVPYYKEVFEDRYNATFPLNYFPHHRTLFPGNRAQRSCGPTHHRCAEAISYQSLPA